jgi:hypothetical protein
MVWRPVAVGDAARVGEPGAFCRRQGAAGLERLLGKQLGGVGGGQQPGLDLGAVQNTAGDQAVQADPGLVEGVVAAALGCLGDRGEFLLEGDAPVGVARCLLTEPRQRAWRLLLDRAKQVTQRPWDLREVGGDRP